MEVEAALHAGVLRLLGLEAAVARIDVAFEHQFGVGERHRRRPSAHFTMRIGEPCTAPAMPISSQPIGSTA